jgi:hypothetical protein
MSVALQFSHRLLLPPTANLLPTDTRKWATLTYVGKETRVIAKLFRNSNIRITYKTNNILQKHLQSKHTFPDKYKQCGIYEIKCNSCPKKYVGQTGRNFLNRFKKHIHAIKSNKTTSKYAQHILESGHTYGKIEDTLNILHHENKGSIMDSWEQFHIHRLTKNNLQLNDAYTDTWNPIFDLMITLYKY